MEATKMTELKDEHLEVISRNKGKKYEIDKLENELSDAKESVEVLSGAFLDFTRMDCRI
jgi:hypothetical protein